jgi:hypothetical protein
VHTTAASDLSAAGGAHRAPALGLAVAGLSEPQCELLRSILVVLEERTERPWRLCDTAQADFVVRTRDAAVTPPPHALLGLFVREGESAPGPECLAVALPLRVMALLDALNAAHDRLAQRRPGAPAAAPAPDDGKSLAAALARLAERRFEHNLRVRIVGVGTLWLDVGARRYGTDFAPVRLAAALEQHRYVMTALAPDAPELAVLRAEGRALEELLWQVGLLSPWERPDRDLTRWRLRRWPDLAQWPHRSVHVPLCAMLAARPAGLAELVAGTGAEPADAMHLLHACVLCGLVEPVPLEAAIAPVAASAPRTSLFERLRRRLGL